MIKLSIIIPHYNSVNSLKKLLNSIPKRKDIQTIVIDDNSDKDIIVYESLKNNIKFQNVTFLKNDSNSKSAGTCRNIGLKAAKGKWILFADSDDFFIEGFYDTVKRYFESKYDVVFFSPTSIYIDTNEISNRHVRFETLIKDFLENPSLENEVKLRYLYVVPWSKLIKRELIEKYNIKFDEVIAMNDILFSTKVGYYMDDFFVTSDVVYCVTRNKGSLTMMMNKEVHDSRVDAFIRHCNFINKNVPKKQKDYLTLTGLNALTRAYRARLGLSEVVSTYKKLRENNIKIINKRFINPFFIIKKALQYIKNHNNEKKYYFK